MSSPSPTPTKRASITSKCGLPPVPPTSFYSAKNTTSRTRTPPPLPERPKKAGSTHTTYISPEEPPAYGAGWREPELVEDDPGAPPSLVEVDVDSWSKPAYPSESEGHWNPTWSAQDNMEWAARASGGADWGLDQSHPGWAAGSRNVWRSASAADRVPIEGRNEAEEERWWDQEARERGARPGYGVLPTLLADQLQLDERVLYNVKVERPAIEHRDPDTAPSMEALAGVLPHPCAYYSPAAHGWVIFQTFNSVDQPKLASPDALHLPAQQRRTGARSCLQSGPGGNKTHHFHRYERAVSSRQLSPPLLYAPWKSSDRRSPKRRRTSPTTGTDSAPSPGSPSSAVQEEELDQELLDLYVCCQCSTSLVVSDILPALLPLPMMEEFNTDKLENPTAGKTGEETLAVGWETLVRIVENRLWKDETRSLPLANSTFARRVGWNDSVRQIADTMGFKVAALEGGGDALLPRVMDLSTPIGRGEEARLLRLWVELSAWFVDYLRRNASKIEKRERKLFVTLESQTENLRTAIGAHVSQIPRGLGPNAILTAELRRPIRELGLIPPSTNYDYLAFAYLAQCRCDPAQTPTYFTALTDIVNLLVSHGDLPPEEIQTLVMDERTRGRFSVSDIAQAAASLGFGNDNVLRVEYEVDEADDDFIIAAWRHAVKASWTDSRGDARRRELNDALRILAHARGSRGMAEAWAHNERVGQVPPERAWQTLGVAKDVDDGTVIAAFSMQVQDQPNQADRLREAVQSIADQTDSVRLRKFLEMGVDPGEVIEPTRADLPRGLNQLGNTCYLNSLLQYFYTIKDLRQAVTALSQAEGKKDLDDSKLTEDDLKRHRVGGRLVTKREILRSRKFVRLLGDLFWEMEYADAAAVTPALELAKLALVTSQDEEEDSASGGARTDSSNDTDATLVEDASVQSRVPLASPVPLSPGSVLGKRARANTASMEDGDEAMQVDTPTDYVMVSKPSSPAEASTPQAGPSNAVASSSRITVAPPDNTDQDGDGDVEMRPVEAPKSMVKRKSTAPASDSVMMFGRQHDVSECMDNCMFQIETALLRFDELAGTEDDKTSIVKSLFYGKLRQRITVVDGSPRRSSRSSVHEKEDPFSHLPLNVSEEGYDLYDGLSGYFDDMVEFEGKPARMEVALVDLPPVLQIQLQRVQFDRDTMTPYKSQAYVKFGDTICMDRFLDLADPQKKAQSKAIQTELNKCRERIQALTKGKHTPYGPALTHTVKYLEHLGALDLTKPDQGTLDVLSGEEKIVDDELRDLRQRASTLKEQLEDVWRDQAEAVYELTSVFIHRGSSPSWGHYFFYSRHLPENPDAWFKYNDSAVTEVPKEEVFADTTGSTANPYLLVYARKGVEIVDTVNRFDKSQLEEAAV